MPRMWLWPFAKAQRDLDMMISPNPTCHCFPLPLWYKPYTELRLFLVQNKETSRGGGASVEFSKVECVLGCRPI